MANFSHPQQHQTQRLTLAILVLINENTCNKVHFSGGAKGTKDKEEKGISNEILGFL